MSGHDYVTTLPCSVLLRRCAMKGKHYLARNVHEGWQVHDPETDEWLTVDSALHITAPSQATRWTFTNGSVAWVHPRGKVVAQRPEATS